MAGNKHGTKLTDLAEACGLSLRVVNAVMTGYSGNVRYSAETKRKVLETATRIGYRPNRFARNLQAGSCGTIAVLVENFFDITESTLDAIIETAGNHSRLILLEKIGPKNPRPKCFSERMSDGFIAIGQVSEQVAAEIDNTGSPCVYVNTNRRMEDNIVTFDERGAMRLAVERFVSRGRKRIALIRGTPSEHYYVKERILGLKSEIRSCSLAKLKVLDHPHGISEAEFQALVFGFLKANPEIDAVLLGMDFMAPAFYDAAKKIGRKVPADISVISVNNSVYSSTARPSITSLGIDRFKVGMLAVEKLVSILEGKKVFLSKLEYKLFPGDSA